MKRLRFAMLVAGLVGFQSFCGMRPLAAQTSVYPVERTDTWDQEINSAFGTTAIFPGMPNASDYGPTTSSAAVSTSQSFSRTVGSGAPTATVIGTLLAEQNCNQGGTVSVPQAQAVVGGAFTVATAAGFDFAGLTFGFTYVVAPATYEIISAPSPTTNPVAYHSVQFLFSGLTDPATGNTFPVELFGVCDTTTLSAIDNGGGFMITGSVGTGSGTTGYSSGPWGSNVNETITGYADHSVFDSFDLIAQMQPTNGNTPFGVNIGPLGGGAGDNDTLAIGVYCFCIVDDH